MVTYYLIVTLILQIMVMTHRVIAIQQATPFRRVTLRTFIKLNKVYTALQ